MPPIDVDETGTAPVPLRNPDEGIKQQITTPQPAGTFTNLFKITAPPPESTPIPTIKRPPPRPVITTQPKIGAVLARPELERKLAANRSGPTPVDEAMNHPIIGGSFAVCTLLYGDYQEMHRQFLGGLLTTLPTYCQLRVATNALCQPTLDFLKRLHDEERIHSLYISEENRKKYPMMRSMFHDPENPLPNWLLWLDDDFMVVDKQWLSKLLSTIIAYGKDNVGIIGRPWTWKLGGGQMAWIKSRPWYRGRQFRLRNGRAAPNGDQSVFASGGCFCISREAIMAADVPDAQLGNNGGDYTINEQLWQNGYTLKSWNQRYQFFSPGDTKRRGLSELHPGMPGWQPGGCGHR